MKTISANLKAHYALSSTTIAQCWRLQRKDGTVMCFTTNNNDVPVNDSVLGLAAQARVYAAATSFTPTSISSPSDISVPNMDIEGILSSASITDIDLEAGLYDNASVILFECNYKDLTQSVVILRAGTVGNVERHKNFFKSEIRGKGQALQQIIGRVYMPTCNASLGDTRCKVSMGPFTVTGSVTSTIDQLSFIDTARTETNSIVQSAVTGITKANPVVVTDPGHPFTSGTTVSLSGVSGMTEINGLSGVVTYIGVNSYSLPIDGTNFTAYSAGGLATKAVASEYFQYGLLTWTSGLNISRSMEVKYYRPNYIALVQPMIRTIQLGDTYSMTAGCDKQLTTCASRFNNIVNNRSFPTVPGIDKLLGYPNAH